jgi:hypothetical protein
MEDDGGVLGRLPRSRPGTRSDKRAAGERPAKGAARAARASEAREPAATPKQRPPAAERPAASAARAPRTGRPAVGRRAPGARPPHSAPPQPGGGPIGDAVRITTKVAEGGVKLATGLTRELLRRLPRP